MENTNIRQEVENIVKGFGPGLMYDGNNNDSNNNDGSNNDD